MQSKYFLFAMQLYVGVHSQAQYYTHASLHALNYIPMFIRTVCLY